MGLMKFDEYGHWLVARFRVDRLTDPVTLADVSDGLSRQLEKLPPRAFVALDFKSVTLVSSQVIGMMLMAKDRVVTRGHGTLVLTRLGPQVKDILRITRLDKQFAINDSLSETLGECANKRRADASEARKIAGAEVSWMG